MANTYEPIQTYSASGNITSISLTSISQAYTDLKIVASFKRHTSGTNWLPYVTFNSNSSSVYSYLLLYTSGGTPSPNQNTGLTYLSPQTNAVDTDIPITFEWDILGYTNTAIAKNVLSTINAKKRTTGGQMYLGSCLFNSTSAITSMQITDAFGNGFGAGTTITLYGILRA